MFPLLSPISMLPGVNKVLTYLRQLCFLFPSDFRVLTVVILPVVLNVLLTLLW